MTKERLVDLDKEQFELLDGIVKQHIPSKTVWAYSPRVDWAVNEKSNLDLVVFDCDPAKILALKEAFAESNLMVSVDVMDWESIPDNFKENIKKKYVVLQEEQRLTGWREVRLGKAPIKIIDGDRGVNYPKQKDFFTSEHCLFLNAKNVTDKGFFFSEPNFITREKDIKLRKGKLKLNDVIVTTRGTVGNIAFYNEKISYKDVRINSGMVIIRPDGIDPRFNYHLFKYLKKDFTSFASGTAQPQLPIRDINQIPILLPPLPEQKAIAEVLSSLDDKIDLLHRQNKTLEDMAQTLFRKWFIEDADDGWETGKLGDVVSSIESGSRPKGGINPELKGGIPSIGAESIDGIGNFNFSNTKFINHDFFSKMNKGKIQSHDVLIYKDGAYIGKKGMFGNGFPFDEMAVNEHVFIVRGNEKITQLFLYFSLEEVSLRSLNTNSAQPGLNQSSMKSFKITLPSKGEIDKFDEKASVVIDKIFYNAKSIRTLQTLRDTLLPKLMSGKIRI